MPSLFPAIEPYVTGMLDVGDGQRLYWETCGNPDGQPALVLHGGPGSGCTPGARRMFDPAAFRIVLFDQRQCGRSTPHASDLAVDLSVNTTPHLLADIEALRTHLGIERWLVYGSSWGSVLGLAYAEAHPERVSALVLSHVGGSRHTDIAWLYHGVGRYFPQDWARFRDGAGVADPNADLVEAYRRRLADPDPEIREKAASDWCDWEARVISVDPSHARPPRYDDPRFRMVFARIVTHYFAQKCWLEDGQLLRDADRLDGIPGALICGRLDLGSPIESAWLVHKAWPGSDLVLVENAGHETSTPGMMESILAAIDRFASV
jgi:proline iminopeptidase